MRRCIIFAAYLQQVYTIIIIVFIFSFLIVPCIAADVDDIQVKLSNAYDSFSANNFLDATKFSRDLLSSSNTDIRCEAEGMLVESVYADQGYDAAMKEIQDLRTFANGNADEIAFLDLLTERLNQENAICKKSNDSFIQIIGQAGGADRDAIYHLASTVVLYGTHQEAMTILDKANSSITPSASAMKLAVIRSAAVGKSLAAIGDTFDSKGQSQLEDAVDAYADNKYGDAVSICEGVLPSPDIDARITARDVIVMSINDQSGYDTAVAKACAFASGTENHPLGFNEVAGLASTVYRLAKMADITKAASSSLEGIPAVPTQTPKASGKPVQSQPVKNTPKTAVIGPSGATAFQCAAQIAVYGTRQDTDAALVKVINGYPKTIPAWSALSTRSFIASQAASPGTSASSDNSKDSPKDKARLYECLDAYGANQFDSATKIASALLASEDHDVRIAAIHLLVLSISDQSGYDTAMNKAWALASGGVEGFKPNRSDMDGLVSISTRISRIWEALQSALGK